MELKIYLVKQRISIVDFAKQVGCSRTHLTEIVNGNRRVGKSLAKVISLATNGEVSEKEILQTYEERQGKKRL